MRASKVRRPIINEVQRLRMEFIHHVRSAGSLLLAGYDLVAPDEPLFFELRVHQKVDQAVLDGGATEFLHVGYLHTSTLAPVGDACLVLCELRFIR